jgi:hypothetical protein
MPHIRLSASLRRRLTWTAATSHRGTSGFAMTYPTPTRTASMAIGTDTAARHEAQAFNTSGRPILGGTSDGPAAVAEA